MKKINAYQITIIILIAFNIIFNLIISPIKVDGISMQPTLQNGQYGLCLHTKNIKDNDIVIIDVSDKDLKAKTIIKRYIADESDDKTIYVLGDNSEHSLDSRVLGNFDREKIIGKVIFY